MHTDGTLHVKGCKQGERGLNRQKFSFDHGQTDRRRTSARVELRLHRYKDTRVFVLLESKKKLEIDFESFFVLYIVHISTFVRSARRQMIIINSCQ